MQITDQQIQQFLEGKASAAEAEILHQYLEQHPEVLEKHLQQSWKEAGDGPRLSNKDSLGMLNAVRDILFPAFRLAKQRTIIRWMTAAACFVLVIFSVQFFSKRNDTAKVPVTVAIERPAEQWVVKSNDTKEAAIVTLEDQSVVTLASGSRIRYKQKQPADKREIYLQGEAFFEVMKDKNRPFTVYTEMLTTTALGTSFTVKESANSSEIKLHTGKVVVKSIQSGMKGWDKDVYLLPGEEVVYNRLQGVVRIVTSGDHVAKKQSSRQSPPATMLTFSHEPLQNVLQQLTICYRREITYSKTDIEGVYFTGQILKTDSLPVILNTIAHMNGLFVSPESNGFLIAKVK